MKQENEIRNLNDYFSIVRKRPAMYLGKKTISMLWDHLQGYKIAFWINNIENAIDKDFFDNFNDFVCNYFSVEYCCDWKSIILEQSFNNEELALSKFFDLWDIFIGDFNEDIYDSRKIVVSIFDEFVFNQEKMKELLGDNFEKTLKEFIDLFKQNLNSLKDDYDFICEKLKEENPELKQIVIDFESGNKLKNRVFS